MDGIEHVTDDARHDAAENCRLRADLLTANRKVASLTTAVAERDIIAAANAAGAFNASQVVALVGRPTLIWRADEFETLVEVPGVGLMAMRDAVSRLLAANPNLLASQAVRPSKRTDPRRIASQAEWRTARRSHGLGDRGTAV